MNFEISIIEEQDHFLVSIKESGEQMMLKSMPLSEVERYQVLDNLFRSLSDIIHQRFDPSTALFYKDTDGSIDETKGRFLLK